MRFAILTVVTDDFCLLGCDAVYVGTWHAATIFRLEEMSENVSSMFFWNFGAYLPILEYVTSHSRRLQSSLLYVFSEYQGLFHSRQRLTGKMKLIILFRLFFSSEQLLWLLSNNLNNTHIWNAIQERTEKFWQLYLKYYNRNIFTDLYNIRFIKWINSHEKDKHWSEHQIALYFLYGSVGMNWRYTSMYAVVLLYVSKKCYAILDIRGAYIDSDIFKLPIKCPYFR